MKRTLIIFLCLLMVFVSIPFFVTAESKIYCGDINKDGRITAQDYAMVKRNVLGTYKLDDEQLDRADCNRNGKVDATDYAMVKRHVLNTFVIQQPGDITDTSGGSESSQPTDPKPPVTDNGVHYIEGTNEVDWHYYEIQIGYNKYYWEQDECTENGHTWKLLKHNDHEWGWCNSKKFHQFLTYDEYYCTVCGERKFENVQEGDDYARELHDFTDWNTLQQADDHHFKIEERHCKVCGYTEYRESDEQGTYESSGKNLPWLTEITRKGQVKSFGYFTSPLYKEKWCINLYVWDFREGNRLDMRPAFRLSDDQQFILIDYHDKDGKLHTIEAKTDDNADIFISDIRVVIAGDGIHKVYYEHTASFGEGYKTRIG